MARVIGGLTEAPRGVQGRFAFVRVVATHPVRNDHQPPRWEWLIIESPEGEEAPSDSRLSNLPETESHERLARLRWTIELDYRQLKASSDWTTTRAAATPASTTAADGAASTARPALLGRPRPRFACLHGERLERADRGERAELGEVRMLDAMLG